MKLKLILILILLSLPIFIIGYAIYLDWQRHQYLGLLKWIIIFAGVLIWSVVKYKLDKNKEDKEVWRIEDKEESGILV